MQLNFLQKQEIYQPLSLYPHEPFSFLDFQKSISL